MNNENNNRISNSKSELLTKIRSIKNIKLIVILLILACFLLCFDYFITSKNIKEDTHMTETELRLASMIEEIEQIDSCEVYINYDKSNSFFGDNTENITGVLVVCKGTDTVSNKFKILNALQKALNIDKDIIEILIL